MIKRVGVALCVSLILAGCVEKTPNKIDVNMYNVSGDSLGTAKFAEQSHGVEVKLDLEGLPPGVHGIHIHEVGKCEAPDFKSAGNHYNLDKKKHGLMNPNGAHAGDLPNLIVKDDGTVKVKLTIHDVTLKDGKGTLYGKNGTALVIHSKSDDGMTQPSGNSGARIACGVITKGLAKKNKAVEEPSKKGKEGQNDLG